MTEYRGRPLVDVGREVVAEVVKVDSISFYGDVDPDKGTLVDGRVVSGKALVARRSRGSTVGAYVMYSLKAKGLAPSVIIVGRADPVIVAGAVLAQIPLISDVPDELFDAVVDGHWLKIAPGGKIELLTA